MSIDLRKCAQEVSACRAAYVDGVIVGRLNRVEGDASIEDIYEWERAAYRRWIETYPTLNGLLAAHLPEHVEVSS